jgi:hypothetical protein
MSPDMTRADSPLREIPARNVQPDTTPTEPLSRAMVVRRVDELAARRELKSWVWAAAWLNGHGYAAAVPACLIVPLARRGLGVWAATAGERPGVAGISVAELADLIDPEAEVMYRVEHARQAYERGFADGRRAGYEQRFREMERAWHAVADPIARGGPTFAELEARRWGPGGRAHFGDPRPGDYVPPRAREATP